MQESNIAQKTLDINLILKRLNNISEAQNTGWIDKIQQEVINLFSKNYQENGFAYGYITDCIHLEEDRVLINLLSNEISKQNFEFVYIISGTHKGESKYKIGKARDYKDRTKLFSVKIPFDIEIISTFRVINAYDIEKQMHSIMKHKRLSGEWFELSDHDITQLRIFGASKEFESISSCIGKAYDSLMNQLRMSDIEYIEYLETLLIMNNVNFERIK